MRGPRPADAGAEPGARTRSIFLFRAMLFDNSGRRLRWKRMHRSISAAGRDMIAARHVGFHLGCISPGQAHFARALIIAWLRVDFATGSALVLL